MSSVHFSRYGLATGWSTPYFDAFWPNDRDIIATLVAAKSRRRLPPNILALADASLVWASLQTDPERFNDPDFSRFYDDELRELDPITGKPLTDEEILATWPLDPEFRPVRDIDLPQEGLPDPRFWDLPEHTDVDDAELLHLEPDQLHAEIRSHGKTRVAEHYGIDGATDMTEDELVKAILSAGIRA